MSTTATLATHLLAHAESNDIDDLRVDWKHSDTGPDDASFDDDFTFICVLPRDWIGTTDDIEAAIDEAMQNVVRKYLRDETNSPDIAIYDCDRDGHATLALTGEGIEVMWTVYVEATVTN